MDSFITCLYLGSQIGWIMLRCRRAHAGVSGHKHTASHAFLSRNQRSISFTGHIYWRRVGVVVLGDGKTRLSLSGCVQSLRFCRGRHEMVELSLHR
jgi:hypothetical protein